jgi:hypothetical protein
MNRQEDSRSVCRTLLEVLVPSSAAMSAARALNESRKPKFRCGRSTLQRAAESRDPGRATNAVSNIEKVSPTLIRLSWSDPRSGHYSDQLWLVCRARQDAFCEMSGLPVHRGDLVFAPRLRKGHYPGNANRVILAAQLRCGHESSPMNDANWQGGGAD